MKLKGRFIFHYGWQSLLSMVLVLLVTFGAFMFLGFGMGEYEIKRDFARGGLEYMGDLMDEGEGEVTFSQKYLDAIKEHGGWLQVLDNKGHVKASFYTPSDVPTRYNPAELADKWERRTESNYELFLYRGSSEKYTLLYGEKPKAEQWIEKAKQEGEVEEGELILPEQLKKELRKNDASLQVFSKDGGEEFSFNKTKYSKDQYTLEDLTSNATYGARYETDISSRYDKETGKTWVVSVPRNISIQFPYSDAQSLEEYFINIFIFVAVIILVIWILFALWYSRRLTKPTLHMVEWLHNLAYGKYEEPLTKRMESKAFKKNGKLKRSYRLFREVNTSLANLTEKLRYNKEMRLRIDEMREEWITGLSHDLKTPLASINGYAQLLVADEQYNWSKEETQKFARTILQKGAYMSELINDLNLTYRLQNDQISLDYEQVELNEFVRRCVISFINDPSHGQHLHFENYQESIYVSIDQALFQRVLENIIANAIKHNEKGTDVWVSILATKEDVFIRVKDNGSGMREETKINLFQRYYRGTNTEERSCGTGLGMAISKQITQLHGAEINVESEVGKGTTITVSFTSVLHKAS
ncbi:sensor histidine kinase [Priestia endophytica]|uniref:sensor histidine kinase n=1 Tax=Priestia endophytica TaxID=135735 RepID=UPI000DCA407B|nr:HAMP domain-containing sensor histidine kinase [Priestia endophytica]RAS73875.1 hypothetical protein A4U60_21995 [Priestia endophytica]